jgi:hypothetical protein
MLRILILSIALAGSAAAAPLVSVAVGPGPCVGSCAQYYVAVQAEDPEPPHESTDPATDDCGYGDHEPGIGFLPSIPDPTSLNTLAKILHALPQCVQGPTLGIGCVTIFMGTGVCDPYVAYNVTTGRYFVDTGLFTDQYPVCMPPPGPPDIPPEMLSVSWQSQVQVSADPPCADPNNPYSGTSGINILFDCLGCPHPP